MNIQKQRGLTFGHGMILGALSVIVTQQDMPPLWVMLWPKKEVRPIRPEEFNALNSYYIYL